MKIANQSRNNSGNKHVHKQFDDVRIFMRQGIYRRTPATLIIS